MHFNYYRIWKIHVLFFFSTDTNTYIIIFLNNIQYCLNLNRSQSFLNKHVFILQSSYIAVPTIPNSFLRRLYLLTILMVDGAFTTAPPVSHLWEHIYCSFINWVVRVLHADWLKDAAYQTIHQWYDQKKQTCSLFFFYSLLRQ